MSHKIRKPSLLTTASVLSLAVLSAPSTAQEQIAEETDTRTLGVVVVTSQKRETTVQDEPIAVSAIGADTITRAGGVDPQVLGELVPNVHVGDEPNRDGVNITIRGVSGTDVRNGADPTTAFHVDGSYVPRLSGANAYFFDLERVEVLRGPQGTLYGRNSTAGVVNVISNKPTFDGYGGNADLTVGNFNLYSASAAVNLPFSDKFAGRIAGTINKRDGYRENVLTEDGDDADDYGLRGHLLFDNGNNTTILATAELYKRQGVGAAEAFFDPPGVNQNLQASDPADTNPLDTQGFRDNQDTNFRLEATQSFDGFDLTYQGAYRLHERDYLGDTDGSAIPEIQSFVTETTESETMTHELRMTSTWDNPFQYILGAYYLEEEINGDFIFGLPRNFGGGPLAGAPRPFRLQFVDSGLTNESIAAFLHTTFDITDKLTLTAGVRHTEDEKDKGGTLDDIGRTPETAQGSYQNVFIEGGPTLLFTPQLSNPTFSKTTWKLGADYQVNENHLLYANAGTGFKAGGYNRGSQPAPGQELVAFEPETVSSYELGWKASLFGNRAQINSAVFYYEYDDLQVGQTFIRNGAPTNQTINAATATVSGLEVEATTVLGETGLLSMTLGLLNAEYDDFVGVDDDTTLGLESLSATGNPLTRAPDITATLSYIPFVLDAFGGTLEPRVQIHYSSDISLHPLNRPLDQQEAYTKSDFSLLYTNSSEAWTLEAFVNNIEDDDIAVFQQCINYGQFGTPIAQCDRGYSAPRTFGARVGVKF